MKEKETCIAAIKNGGIETKLSMFLMGFGNIVHKQKIKGLLFMAAEIAYIVFMLVNGIHLISMLGSLGSVPQKEVWDEAQQVYIYTQGDQSVLILLYGVATVFLSLLMVWGWRGALKSAYKAELLDKNGHHVNTFAEDLKSLLNENLHRLLMTPPMIFIFGLTILPLIFMICMAFTNYSKLGNHLMLFDWVGLENFKALFSWKYLLVSPWLDACVGVFRNLHKLHFRYDPFSCDKQKGDKGKRLLEILFCYLLRSADVCFSSYYENHASAKRCGERASSKSGNYCPGRKPSVFYRSYMGESDSHCH